MTAKPCPLVGAWNLLSYQAIAEDGSVSEPLGADPSGLGVYTPDGIMSAHLMRRNRPRFGRPPSPGDSGPDEPETVAAAFDGYIGYTGTYVVDETSHIVEHHVECSLLPNWEATVLRRAYELDGDRLVLRPLGTVGRQAMLVWHRRA